MIQTTVLVSLTALFACSGDKTDTGDTTDTHADDVSIDFAMTYVDAATGAGLAGAEVCVTALALGEENCETADANGLIEWTWDEPVETNMLSRLEVDDYFRTLYTGRYDEALGEWWKGIYGETGAVELTYFAWSRSLADVAFQIAGTAHEEGMGHVAYGLVSQNDDSMAGATVVLTDEAGESVGEVLYVNALGTAFDTTLDSTSIAGGVGILNVAPGTYTLSVTSADFSCLEGFSWKMDGADAVELPIEADSMTLGSLFCL